MSAERLREAAKVLRERAEATLCTCGGSVCSDPLRGWYLTPELESRFDGDPASVQYIQMIGPAVGLAVATALFMAADHDDGRGNTCGSCLGQLNAVADAILGGA